MSEAARGEAELPGRGVEEYLGDGLYVSFDGFQVILRAPRGGGGDHFVALEPSVWRALQGWLQRYPMLKGYMERR